MGSFNQVQHYHPQKSQIQDIWTSVAGPSWQTTATSFWGLLLPVAIRKACFFLALLCPNFREFKLVHWYPTIRRTHLVGSNIWNLQLSCIKMLRLDETAPKRYLLLILVMALLVSSSLSNPRKLGSFLNLLICTYRYIVFKFLGSEVKQLGRSSQICTYFSDL